MRPEFAAWRSGEPCGARRRRAPLSPAGGLALFGGVVFGGAVTGVGVTFMGQIPSFWASRTLVKLRTEDGGKLRLNNTDLLQTRLQPSDDEVGYRLEVGKGKKKRRWFEGEEARRVAAIVLPRINRMGGKESVVQGAVGEIAHHGHPEAFLKSLVDGNSFKSKKGVPGYVNKMPKPTQLALEMALHEEQERRALEGELWRLERAWRAAEEIAGISDNLLLPEGADDFVAEHSPEV
jgi:hypothetical protein